MVYALKERRDFALWAHATVCFENCARMCELIHEKGLHPSDELFKPLSVCALVEYAKPFMKSNVLGNIPKEVIREIIPGDRIELHEFAVQVRDKVVAHLDTDHPGKASVHIHGVRLNVTEKGLWFLVQEPKVRPEFIAELRKLASDLAVKARYYVNRHLKNMHRTIRDEGLGEFEIDLAEESCKLRKLGKEERAEIFWE